MQYCRNFETLIIQRNLGNKKVKKVRRLRKGRIKLNPQLLVVK